MRINLQTPFAEKDQAKALGARWDASQKTWYVLNVEDLSPFKRWLPEGATEGPSQASPGASAPVGLAPSPSKTARPDAKPPKTVITRSHATLAACACAVLPWEPCPHSKPSNS